MAPLCHLQQERDTRWAGNSSVHSQLALGTFLSAGDVSRYSHSTGCGKRVLAVGREISEMQQLMWEAFWPVCFSQAIKGDGTGFPPRISWVCAGCRSIRSQCQ